MDYSFSKIKDKQLNCVIKLPVSLTLETKSKLDSSLRCGCKIIDVTFQGIINPEVGEICFKNYYVAFVTVKMKIKLPDQSSREGIKDHGWRIALKRFRLMPNPHAETGALDNFSITKKQFQCEMSNVVALRIILQQPSPQWKDFWLEDLKFFRPTSMLQVSALPAYLMESGSEKSERKKLEGVPDLNVLSSDLQQLWALAEETGANQTQESLGRYEVDGCYDINLLSYT